MVSLAISSLAKVPQQSAVLVLGSYRQTIAVVRSLARAGYRVIVGNYGPSFTHYSRFLGAYWDCREHDEANGDLTSALERGLREGRFGPSPILFPIGERQIIAVSRMRADPRARARACVMPSPEAIASCLDKSASLEIARRAGLPLPRGREASGADEIRAASREVGYPLVLKHHDSSQLLLDQKALICGSASDLDRALGELDGQSLARVLVQRQAGGRRRNCQFVARHGELLAYFEQVVLRTDAPNGTGYGVEGISVAPTASLRAHTAALARALDYSGPGCAQFLFDENSGEIAFLELNPRLDANVALAVACGMNLPRWAVEIASGVAPSVPAEYPVGVRIHWLSGDLLAWVHCVRRRQVGFGEAARWLARALRAAFSADLHMVWDWRDPLPSLSFYGFSLPIGFLRSLLRRY